MIDSGFSLAARYIVISEGLNPELGRETAVMRVSVRPVMRAARHALEVLLPPQCLACDALVSDPGTLCHACRDGAVFLSAPLCAACGTPFAFDHGPDALCGACLRDRPRIDRTRAIFVYNDVSRSLTIGLKHRDRTHVAPALGRWQARCAGRTTYACVSISCNEPARPRARAASMRWPGGAMCGARSRLALCIAMPHRALEFSW